MKFSRNFEVLDQALLGYVYTRETFSRFKNVSEFTITFGYSLSQPFTQIILSEKILSDKSLKIQD